MADNSNDKKNRQIDANGEVCKSPIGSKRKRKHHGLIR